MFHLLQNNNRKVAQPEVPGELEDTRVLVNAFIKKLLETTLTLLVSMLSVIACRAGLCQIGKNKIEKKERGQADVAVPGEEKERVTSVALLLSGRGSGVAFLERAKGNGGGENGRKIRANCIVITLTPTHTIVFRRKDPKLIPQPSFRTLASPTTI